MIKGVSRLLFLSLLAMTSCSQHDTLAGVEDPVDDGQSASVNIVISRAGVEEFAQAGISELTIYTYRVLRKSTELYKEETVSIGDGVFAYQFPLGETFQTIVTANVGEVSGKEALETLTLTFDPLGGKEVWASPVTRFSSDKTVTTLDLTLERLVARVNFVPAESAAELAAVSEFDALDIRFSNVAASYMPATGMPVLSDLTVSTDASQGYRKTFYTFETSRAGENSSIFISYLKGGVEVNQSASLLDTGVTYEASSSYSMTVPITAPDYQLLPWSIESRSGLPAIEIVKTKL